MNELGIFTTVKERKQYSLDTEYKFIKKEGTYDLVLEHRAWNDNRLECYFFDDLNPDISIKAYIFIRRDKNGNSYYKPKNSDIDFRYAEEGKTYKCTFRLNKKNFVYWDNAVLINE
ncbi:hypothetical protein EQY97_10160 [Clostridium perfringens]|nr:hypothetical protein [Clostridium perfringens]